MSLDRAQILLDISAERSRQEMLKAAGKFPHTCADVGGPQALTPADKLAVLAEEFGEVAREVAEWVIADSRGGQEGGPAQPSPNLYKELIQLAAVAVAWCESLAITKIKNEQSPRDCKLMCDHEWVLDGHNAGEPICSKCWARMP